MADTFQEITNGFIQGLRDGILGTFRVKKFCDAEREQRRKRKSSSPKPTTVLEQRRLRREQNRETTPPKKDKESESNIMQRILICCAWNGGLFLMSILVFNKVLLPTVQMCIHFIFRGSGNHSLVWSWMQPVLSWTFSTLWILPIFVLSKIVNCLWFQDIADSAYFYSRGQPKPINIGVLIADIAFSMILQACFLIQGTLCLSLPIPAVGSVIFFLHMSLLYSLYAFEYKWLNMGWEVHKRLEYIQGSWPYFLGFGLPMAIVTSLDASAVVSGCLFSMFFPVFIISANEATEPSHKCSFPLKLFGPVVALSNAVFSHVSLFGRSRNTAHTQDKSATPVNKSSPKKHVNISETRDFR